jgi:hypothetical protein
MRHLIHGLLVAASLASMGCIAQMEELDSERALLPLDTPLSVSAGDEPTLAPTILFSEDFSGGHAGWTLGKEWQIGPARTYPAPVFGPPDPAFDHTPTSDNRIAGTLIGAAVSVAPAHDPYFLTSPVINADVPGNVTLSFFRYLHVEGIRLRALIEVFDGRTWVSLFDTGYGFNNAVMDTDWTAITYDLTPYKNPNLRVRFGHSCILRFAGGPTAGWNLDDITITAN